MLRNLWIVVIVVLASSGCGSSGDDVRAAHPVGGSVTLWTEKTELFLEYPALIVGSEIALATHLSWMSDFKPVTEGTVAFHFTSSTGEILDVTVSSPASPGIFRPTLKFTAPGTYRLVIHLSGRERDTLVIDHLNVYTSAQDVPDEPESQSKGQKVGFLKEQQWKTDFRTERVGRETIGSSIRSAAEVIPAVNREAIVAAPFTGYIPADANLRLPTPGSTVRTGAMLAIVHPSAETPGGNDDFSSRYTEAETERELAKREFERVRQLFSKESVSEREYQEAEADYRRAEATFKALSALVTAEPDSPLREGGFRLTAPITGTIVEVNVVPGQQVTAGAPLFRIINLDRVWIRGHVVAGDIGKVRNPDKSWLTIAGMTAPLLIGQRNGRLVSIGSAIDEKTRTLPLIFERANTDRSLRIGMVGELRITGSEQHEGLVVPESALMEEEGRYSVYVHLTGEEFEKRDVVLGAQERDRVEIIRGLDEGERVVTVGAYQVRLSSMSTQLPAHGHVH